VARRGAPLSLAALAREVVEFHEAPLEEAGLRLQVEGDAVVAVDEPLLKRALSNLLGNATRFAEPGSTVRVCISSHSAEAEDAPARVVASSSTATSTANSATSAADAATAAAAPRQVRVEVYNAGRAIDEQDLPRLFDRFFRADVSRCEAQQHHGLGLAIVAAIARMHAGSTLAASGGGVTRVGFTLAAHQAPR
jgi:two-component system heavy metal sensor histidine kinase CusS